MNFKRNAKFSQYSSPIWKQHKSRFKAHSVNYINATLGTVFFLNHYIEQNNAPLLLISGKTKKKQQIEKIGTEALRSPVMFHIFKTITY
jgi:hypothetical protein